MRYLLSFVFLGALCPGGLAETSPVTPADIRVSLELQPDALEYGHWQFSDILGFAFEKELAYEGASVYRSAFPCGLPYALDVQGERLYIDANRNMDLTDDADHVYAASDEWPLEFKDVRLQRKDAREPRLVDISFSAPSKYRYKSRSWEGTVEIAERDFLLVVNDTIEDDSGRRITIRPLDWEIAPQWLEPNGYFGVSDRLYDIAIEQHGSDVEVIFSEITDDTAVMFMDAHTVRTCRDLITSTFFPDKRLRLPAGRHSLDTILLKDGDTVFRASLDEEFEALDGAVLEFGSPLRETVSARRVINRLEFTHQIKGKGGEEYRFLPGYGGSSCPPLETPDHMPVLTVKQGDKVVLQDKFAVRPHGRGPAIVEHSWQVPAAVSGPLTVSSNFFDDIATSSEPLTVRWHWTLSLLPVYAWLALALLFLLKPNRSWQAAGLLLAICASLGFGYVVLLMPDVYESSGLKEFIFAIGVMMLLAYRYSEQKTGRGGAEAMLVVGVLAIYVMSKWPVYGAEPQINAALAGMVYIAVFLIGLALARRICRRKATACRLWLSLVLPPFALLVAVGAVEAIKAAADWGWDMFFDDMMFALLAATVIAFFYGLLLLPFVLLVMWNPLYRARFRFALRMPALAAKTIAPEPQPPDEPTPDVPMA